MNELIASILAEITDDQPAPVIKKVLKFSITRGALLPLLNKAIAIIPTRDVMPVLKCFQLHVDPHLLRIIASDAEKTLLLSTRDIATGWPGVAVFPARKLLDIVKSASGDDTTIDVSITGNTATITIGRTHWTLTLQSGVDYPAMPALGDTEFTIVNRLAFLTALASVRYAASQDPSRPNLNVIDISDATMTATNGTRIQQIPVADLNINMRIPVTIVDDLLKLLRASDTRDLHVGQSDNKLIFRFGPELFITSRYHAEFPNLEASLLRPALENKHILNVYRNALLAAIRRVRINADTESAAIALTAEKYKLTVSAVDKFGNTAAETIDADWSGNPRILVVHHGYLTDMINTYGDEQCSFRLGDDTKTRRSPLLLRHDSTGAIAVTQQMQGDWANR